MSSAQRSVVRYLGHYPPAWQQAALELLSAGSAGTWLLQRHPHAHTVRSDAALQAHVQALRTESMRHAAPIQRVSYDARMRPAQHLLGSHTTTVRPQGQRLRVRHEIRIASLFRDAPWGFLQMICAHELAHLKEGEHNKAFYQLCTHIEPEYHQLEWQTRLYLAHREMGGDALWNG